MSYALSHKNISVSHFWIGNKGYRWVVLQPSAYTQSYYERQRKAKEGKERQRKAKESKERQRKAKKGKEWQRKATTVRRSDAVSRFYGVRFDAPPYGGHRLPFIRLSGDDSNGKPPPWQRMKVTAVSGRTMSNADVIKRAQQIQNADMIDPNSSSNASDKDSSEAPSKRTSFYEADWATSHW